MNDLGLSLTLCAALAVFAGCGGSQPPIGAPGTMPQSRSITQHVARDHKKLFKYTGSMQTFVVPSSVTEVTIAASGAGGTGPSVMGTHGGLARATFQVTPGETLYVFVGGAGAGRFGGFNGGGNGGDAISASGYGGGGASDVREGGADLKDRIIVAAGGGGTAGPGFSYGTGGDGGGRKGSAGFAYSYAIGGGGGGGATMQRGGRGGQPGKEYHCRNQGKHGINGEPGIGGTGGNAACRGGGGGGGGGGGYRGGGGGGGSSGSEIHGTGGGGGGGGSSFIKIGANNRINRKGGGAYRDNGQVTLLW